MTTAERSLFLVAIVTLFPLALAGMFALVSLAIARIGGWSRLAARYRADAPPDGTRHVRQTGRVGWASYRGALTLTVGDDGLFLAVAPLFRAGHPPLFIPWSAMHRPRRSRLRILPLVTVDVGEPPVTTLGLPEAVFDEGDAGPQPRAA